jgi:glycosyltransferase involved in cell wall biosynthesis
MKPKIAMAANAAWNFVNFRAGLIRALVQTGYEVVAIAPSDGYVASVVALGCRFVALPMDNQGTHPGRDLLLAFRFYQILSREQPEIYLGYTVKPNVYGSLVAHALGIPVINNITGLGSVFIKENWLSRLVRGLYRMALSRSAKVFFQNDDDRSLFIASGLVHPAITDRLPGSGIDTTRFLPIPLPARPTVRFLLIARMLWDKGIGEYVEAARMLKQRGISAEICLLGFLDVRNPAAISRRQMNEWVNEGVVHYLGVSDTVVEELATADCVVLPSYREGVPRTLLEAAAVGRPIITTDSIGCREVVDNGINGYLIQPRNASDLAEKMELMISLTWDERNEMGKRSREKVEREFDERIVISKYLESITEILGHQGESLRA